MYWYLAPRLTDAMFLLVIIWAFAFGVWVCDITYIRLFQEFIFLAVVMDVFTRSIRGWNLSRSLDISLTLEALLLALEDGVPEIHHSDQGIQYAAQDYVQALQARHVQRIRRILEGDGHGSAGSVDHQVAVGKGGVAQTVPKGEQHVCLDGVIIAVADVDALAVLDGVWPAGVGLRRDIFEF